jgi:hypothetical protein
MERSRWSAYHSLCSGLDTRLYWREKEKKEAHQELPSALRRVLNIFCHSERLVCKLGLETSGACNASSGKGFAQEIAYNVSAGMITALPVI